MKAKALDAITVHSDETRDGIRILETECTDYDHFKRLPRAVSCDGKVFGLTGWNSDSCRAYFRSDARVCFPL